MSIALTFYRNFGRRPPTCVPWFSAIAVILRKKMNVLCIMSAFQQLMLCTRKPCCGRETARCPRRCKIREAFKFTAASRGFPCDSTALV